MSTDTPSREVAAAVAAALRHGNKADALIEILHDLQAELGFIPEAALPALARSLNLSRAEVHGVVTFYHDFQREPAGRHVIKICRAEACQSMGAENLAALVQSSLKTAFGETTDDGAISVQAVYCLGNCALAPAIMVDDRLVGRVDAERFRALVEECRT
ncbi:MAG: formate dehydrogenase subunit gamma [Alphaproteobacteria bacterium]|nr:formate dehydrogenase subunit gamma [Alphaproteobacteria bacterium]